MTTRIFSVRYGQFADAPEEERLELLETVRREFVCEISPLVESVAYTVLGGVVDQLDAELEVVDRDLLFVQLRGMRSRSTVVFESSFDVLVGLDWCRGERIEREDWKPASEGEVTVPPGFKRKDSKGKRQSVLQSAFSAAFLAAVQVVIEAGRSEGHALSLLWNGSEKYDVDDVALPPHEAAFGDLDKPGLQIEFAFVATWRDCLGA